MDHPLISIVILSYNRREELGNTLSLLRAISYSPLEVIVVDNNSHDGSCEMVLQDFPGVTLIPLSKNIGIAGWNEGFVVARGKYTLALDDDSAPLDGALEEAMDCMNSDPGAGVFAFHIVNRNDDPSETTAYSERPISFVGCGALIRTSLFPEIGFFSPFLFLYMHEIDFAIRVVDAGYHLLHKKSAVVVHRLASSHRDVRGAQKISARKYFYDNRNTMLILFKYFPLRRIFLRIIRIAIGRTLHSLRCGYFGVLMKVYLSAIRALPAILRERKIVCKETQTIYSFGAFAGGFFFTGDYGFSRPRFLSRNPQFNRETK